MIPTSNPYGQYKAYRIEIDSAIRRVLESGQYILGKEVEEFEHEFAGYLGAEFGIGVASGTDALRISLLALGIGTGDEVIMPALTSVATAMAVLSVGATPVLADVEMDTFVMSAASAGHLISEQTRAIIPVHLYGRGCDMDGIRDLTEHNGISLVEDCAHAHGATWNGRKLGTFGDTGSFSFYPTKNLGAFGDGGLIITGDGVLAEKLRALRQHGFSDPQVSLVTGDSSRLDEIQAAILRIKLNHLDEMNEARFVIASRYEEALEGLPVVCPQGHSKCRHIFHQYVVRDKNRNDMAAFLESRNIGTTVHYPLPIHRQPFWEEEGHPPCDLPVTDLLVAEILSLPIDPFMTEKEQEAVIAAVKDYYG